MSAQGAGGGGAAEQNPGQGARPAQQVQGILSLGVAGENEEGGAAGGRAARPRPGRAVRAPMCHGALYWEPG